MNRPPWTLVAHEQRARVARRVVTLAVVVPHLAIIAAVFWHQHVPITWFDVALFVAAAVLTKLGVTAGFHRLYSHRAYETVRPVAFTLGVLGSMAAQGPLSFWVSLHRLHHARSDRPGDPHSPITPRAGPHGFVHGHMAWMFRLDLRDKQRFINDLKQDHLARFVSRHYASWVLLGLALPTMLGLVVGGAWTTAVSGLLWGGLLRIAYVDHVTWCVNSVCHKFGSRPFDTPDGSRNNVVVALLALGEGWHNNHHASPRAVRHGLGPWQLDLTYLFIRGLQLVGLAQRLHQPRPSGSVT